jgi:diguanylate cyclase (GGDEF)-like protein
MDAPNSNLTPDEQLWQSALQSLASPMAVLDREGRVLAASAKWRSIPASLAVIPAGILRSVLEGRRREVAQVCAHHGSHAKRWYLLRVAPCDGPGLARALLTCERLTEAAATEFDLRRQAEALGRCAAFEAARSRILEMVAQNEHLDPVLVEIAATVERQIAGARCAVAILRRGGCDVLATRELGDLSATISTAAVDALSAAASQTPYLSILSSALQQAGGDIRLHLEIVREIHGEPEGVLAVWNIDVPLAQESGELVIRAAALAGIALDHARTHERLSFQALHDSLTGLPNRLLFQDRLHHALRVGKREGNAFAVVLVDLDRFRRINDVHGPRIRDSLLRDVALRLQSCISTRDTLARSAGDEFLILLQSSDHVRDPARVARRITAVFDAPFRTFDSEFQVSCSIGIARFPGDGFDAADMVRNAGTALYEARQQGAGNYRIYEPGMGVVARERVEIERCLRGAIDAGELELHYQAQFDSRRRPAVFEALLRWNSPVLGSVPPTRFIPVAEHSGLILPIGAWVLRRACRHAVEWSRAGYAAARVAVNVSALQLMRPDFADTVAQVLEETGMDPGMLELEVTESAMIRNLSHAVEQIEVLRGSGVSFAVDDFGTGYSSLSYLRNLPVDTLKIDRAFVCELDKGVENCDSIVRAIISLAHSLGMRVVAEGVETEAQFLTLASLGCDLFQGYLLARPLPATRLGLLLRSDPDPERVTSWVPNRAILAPEASSS